MMGRKSDSAFLPLARLAQQQSYTKARKKSIKKLDYSNFDYEKASQITEDQFLLEGAPQIKSMTGSTLPDT